MSLAPTCQLRPTCCRLPSATFQYFATLFILISSSPPRSSPSLPAQHGDDNERSLVFPRCLILHRAMALCLASSLTFVFSIKAPFLTSHEHPWFHLHIQREKSQKDGERTPRGMFPNCCEKQAGAGSGFCAFKEAVCAPLSPAGTHFKWHIFHKMTLTFAPIGVNMDRKLPVDFPFGIFLFSRGSSLICSAFFFRLFT